MLVCFLHMVPPHQEQSPAWQVPSKCLLAEWLVWEEGCGSQPVFSLLPRHHSVFCRIGVLQL